MAFLPQVFTFNTMPSGNSVTSSLELPGCYLNVYLEVPTMSAGFSIATPIWIKGSSDGTTFRRYTNPENNTSTVGTNDFQIVSACSQRMVLIPNFAFRYMQVEISGIATGANATPPQFKVICVSNQ